MKSKLKPGDYTILIGDLQSLATLTKIKIDRTPNTWGEIKILSCEPQRFGNLTLEDARNEGFFSIEEYKKYFYEVNGHISDDDLVWVIKFEKIWTSFFVEEPIAIEL